MRFVAVISLLLLALVPSALAQGGASNAEVDPYPTLDRWVEGALEVDQPDFTTMEITSFLTIRKFEVEGTDYSSADDISKAYFQLVQADEFARGAGQASDRAEKFIADMEEETTGAMRDMLARAFPDAAIEVELATLDRDTLEEPDSRPFSPGIALSLTASVVRTPQDVGLGDRPAADLQALLDAGAEVATDLTFQGEGGYDVTYTLSPPAGNVFASANGGTLSTDGSRLFVPVPGDDSRVPVGVVLRGKTAPRLTEADATIDVKVDLKDLDITMGKALSGDFGNLLVDLTVDAELNVVEVPDALKASLPDKVSIDFLSAKSLRILVERGIITEANLSSLDEKLLEQVTEKLGSALGGSIPVEGGLDRASLAASVEDGKPVVFHASASVLKPLAGGAVQPQAAIALYTTQLPLTLPKIQGLDTVYTVIMPRGLALTDVSGSGVERGTSDDGRDQFTVRPEGESTQVTASVAVTPTLVMAKFWPLVLLAVVLIVLVIGTPVTLVVMKRRKSKSGADATKTADKK